MSEALWKHSVMHYEDSICGYVRYSINIKSQWGSEAVRNLKKKYLEQYAWVGLHQH